MKALGRLCRAGGIPEGKGTLCPRAGDLGKAQGASTWYVLTAESTWESSGYQLSSETEFRNGVHGPPPCTLLLRVGNLDL